MTLVIAWKCPISEGDDESGGIRILADSRLMDGPNRITDSFSKLHSIIPKVRYPETRHDQDWAEFFSSLKELFYAPIGMVFAGSSLSFQTAAARIQNEMAKLGLTVIGETEEDCRTVIVRDSKAEKYSVGEWMSSKRLNPPPPFDIGAASEVISHEMTLFFRGRNKVVAPYSCGPNGEGMLKFGSEIGLFGYCEYSQSFEIIRISPKPTPDDLGTSQPIYSAEKLKPGEILLLGINEAHQEILARIEQAEIDLEQDTGVQGPLSSAVELVFEEIMADDHRFPEVGGKVCSAEVSKEFGFRILEDPDGVVWTKPRSFNDIIPRRVKSGQVSGN